MFRVLSEGPLTVDALVGRRAIKAILPSLDRFRAEVADDGEPFGSVSHHLDWTWVLGRMPVVVSVSRPGQRIGIVLFSVRCKFGVPIGIANAGDPVGEGGVIARPEDRRAVVEAACKGMINVPYVHTVLCSLRWSDTVSPGTIWPMADIRAHWHFRQTQSRLSLVGGVEATMDRLGYKMRRNIRSYRRRAEERFGCRFVPDLTEAQRREAVGALHRLDVYGMGLRSARRRETVLSRLPGAFAAGAQDASGAWLSYVAGRRGADDTQIIWQLNNTGLPNASMSTVMRSYLVEHAVERGSAGLVFIGGASPLWGRACEPELCGDLLALSPGVTGTAARRLTRWLSPEGQIAKLHALAG